MALIETMTTERLRLRPARLEDAASICERWSHDAEVTRYLGWRPYRDADVARTYLEDALRGWAEGNPLLWGIELRDEGGLIGQIGAHIEGSRVLLGYVLARPYWGRGYMAEAVRAVIGAALADPLIWRVWAVCDVENRPSARVMEKAGMRFEGCLRRWMVHPNVSDRPRDVLCYAKVR
jgi:[ribosomal protein S5]-alanine N-acetyltransferase